MNFKGIISTVLCLILIFSLSGCGDYSANTAELLSPPSLSGDILPIAEAIKKSAGNDYTLKYPSRGEYRSAVIQRDVDGDGVIEAFAFYSMVDGDVTTMTINLIKNKKGKWISVSEQKIVAGGVDKVEFCDLDGDGTEEILVGWEIYSTSEMQLGIYSLKKDTLSQRMLQKYTHFLCCDLNEDDKNEVFLIKFDLTEQINMASLLSLTKDGVSEISSCTLDTTVKTVNEPILSALSSGKTAIYVDELKGAGAITEVLYFSKDNTLYNPLFDEETNTTVKTLRSSSLMTTDINNDGIMEIPVQTLVPSITKSDVNEKLYLTNWCSFNGELLTIQMTTMMNLNDGYYFSISPKLVGKIAVLKDIENSVREIYKYNSEDSAVGGKYIYFQVVKKKDFDNGKYDGFGYKEIVNDGEKSYLCWLSDTALGDGVTFDEIKSNFKLLD